jgi:phage host-nuclease inhibitor protein Gam
MKIDTLDQMTDALAAMRRERTLQQSITAELNAELARVKDRHEPDLTKHAAEEKRLAEAVRAFVEGQRGALLGKAKSFKVEGHTIGFRSNGGAISFTKKSGGAKGVLQTLRDAGGKLAKLFIRTKEDLDKSAMKENWEQHGPVLQEIGVRLTEEELFFIELDMEGNPKA